MNSNQITEFLTSVGATLDHSNGAKVFYTFNDKQYCLCLPCGYFSEMKDGKMNKDKTVLGLWRDGAIERVKKLMEIREVEVEE